MKLTKKLCERLNAMTAMEGMYAGLYLAKRAAADFIGGYEQEFHNDKDVCADQRADTETYIAGATACIEHPIGGELAGCAKGMSRDSVRRIEQLIEDFIRERTP